jgi:hypothetical protein
MNTLPRVKCGNILLSGVVTSTRDTHEACHNTLLNLSACNSGAGTAAWERVLRRPGGRNADDNAR